MIYFTECAPGFAGDNCIDTCPYPRYGSHCNDTCDCSNSSCHHVYGCIITTSTASGRLTRDFFLEDRIILKKVRFPLMNV